MPTIITEKLTKTFPVSQHWRFRRGVREIGVENVDITIEQGEFVFVIGSCGAGKSTLLSLLAGKIRPDSGTVRLDDKPVKKPMPWRKNRLSTEIGYVPQRYALEHGVTIREILEASAKSGAGKFLDWNDYDSRVKKVLGLTGLSGWEDRYPIELTYGQRRMLELARALINSPKILVLDEITAGLDADSMWDVYMLLNEINRMGITIVMATRNSFYVNMARNRVITLVHGRVYSDEENGRYGEVKAGRVVQTNKKTVVK